MVVNINFAPTLLEIAGVKVATDIQGQGFWKLLSFPSSKLPWRNEMYYHFYEYHEPQREGLHFGIRTEHYKLIRFYGPVNHWELFDLKYDKTEMQNLYANVKCKQVLQQ